MSILYIFLVLVFILLSVLMCWQESKTKIMPMWLGLLLCMLVTPFVCYLIYRFLPNKVKLSCIHCGNEYNEAEYCGLCGKNIEGEFHPTWKNT